MEQVLKDRSVGGRLMSLMGKIFIKRNCHKISVKF